MLRYLLAIVFVVFCTLSDVRKVHYKKIEKIFFIKLISDFFDLLSIGFQNRNGNGCYTNVNTT
ncbi:hypothetical protein AY599_22030 [Leptolyngbya valderiana BDU 20041]|nr:hypothetical protein AY599_22030 [Leptolyngbya valderiana BDU 20041]